DLVGRQRCGAQPTQRFERGGLAGPHPSRQPHYRNNRRQCAGFRRWGSVPRGLCGGLGALLRGGALSLAGLTMRGSPVAPDGSVGVLRSGVLALRGGILALRGGVLAPRRGVLALRRGVLALRRGV